MTEKENKNTKIIINVVIIAKEITVTFTYF